MNLKFNEGSESEIDIVSRWSEENPAFDLKLPSSKIKKLMEVLKKQVLQSEDKAVIASKFTSFLSIIRTVLQNEGVAYCEVNGKVRTNARHDIVLDFNKKKDVKVMLLSLKAEVGSNLIGANYLMLMDLHLNPQWEKQALDRIYHPGQKKNVKIFK